MPKQPGGKLAGLRDIFHGSGFNELHEGGLIIVNKWEGVFSVVPTPFHPDGRLDEESLQKAVQLFLSAGVNGLTVLGVTSEVSRLTDSEKSRIINLVLAQTAGKVPVIAGTTAEGTQTCVEASKTAVQAGVSAVMVSPPRMPKLNSDAVIRHYQAISVAIELPIVVQDYPPSSGYSMEASLLARIVREVPSAKVIKLEDAPTPLKIARIREIAGDVSVSILGGLGGMYLIEELFAGANGAMTGFAIPEILIEVVTHFRNGSIEVAKELFYRHVALMRFEFQEGIGLSIRKEILRRRGVFASAVVRAPGAGMDASTLKTLDHLLDWYKKEGCPWIPD